MPTRRHFAVLGLLTLLVGFGSLAAGAEPITTGTLLDEMVDMVGLAGFPDPAYKTVQFSSYDRRSSVPGGPSWFANSDGFGREPQPNFEAVLVEPNEQGIPAPLEPPVALARPLRRPGPPCRGRDGSFRYSSTGFVGCQTAARSQIQITHLALRTMRILRSTCRRVSYNVGGGPWTQATTTFLSGTITKQSATAATSMGRWMIRDCAPIVPRSWSEIFFASVPGTTPTLPMFSESNSAKSFARK